LGGELTQPVVAGGKLYVSQINSHRIYCLDSQAGDIEWSFSAGGKVDSSPTYYRGLLLFGAADGWVYCLRASDGELVWRFRGAPHERRIVSFGQLESPWPVHGSVLVKDDVVYFLAGRSSHIDDGMYLFVLDPQTGEKLYENQLKTPRPNIPEEHGRPSDMEGMRSEILVVQGDYIYLRRAKFNRQLEKLENQNITKLGDRNVGLHLFSNTNLLDNSRWDRRYWMYSSRWPGFYFVHQAPKSGSILVFNDSVTYANKHYDRISDHSPYHVHGQGNLLYADDNDTEPILVGEDEDASSVQWLPELSETVANSELGSFSHPALNYDKGPGFTRPQPPLWSQRISLRTRAMVLAGNLLYIAGPTDAIDPEDPFDTFTGKDGAYLQVISASGKTRSTYKLDSPPVFDGLIAAENRLFMSSIDGRIQCFGSKDE
ncbi:MAG: PQQ-binding-like beta-propeller repeat protein, partial [Bacteroidales bacterium]|nr:PQQ-binding-like beta-propeller repeat protein [Bacteroidales bacterium]